MKKIILLLFVLLALSLFLSCNKHHYAAKINPLLDKYIEAWNTGNLSLLKGIVDSTFELRKVPDYQPIKGIDKLKAYIINTRKVVPDFFLKETDKRFLSDTAVVITWTCKGTYQGENDLPPTGSKMNISGFSIIYFNKKMLTGEWLAFSDLTWVKQLGFQLSLPEEKK
jgi:hypothetical protein